MATGTRGYLNNYATTLDGAITNVATSIDIADTGGTINTLLSSYDYVALTIDDGSDIEVIHVTADSSGTLTVERGQDGTSGVAFASLVPVECRPTAESFKFENLSDVDFSGGAPSENDQLKFDASGNLIPFAASGGGEFSVVETQTLGSTTAEVTFDISTAGTYKIVLDRVQHNSTATLLLTVAYDDSGTTYGASNYQYTQRETNSNSATFTNNRSTSASNIVLCSDLSADTPRTIEGFVMLREKDAAKWFSCNWDIMNAISFGHCKKQTGSGNWKDTTYTLVEAKLAVSGGVFSIGSKFHLLRRNY
jgi:hypothetical protein